MVYHVLVIRTPRGPWCHNIYIYGQDADRGTFSLFDRLFAH